MALVMVLMIRCAGYWSFRLCIFKKTSLPGSLFCPGRLLTFNHGALVHSYMMQVLRLAMMILFFQAAWFLNGYWIGQFRTYLEAVLLMKFNVVLI